MKDTEVSEIVAAHLQTLLWYSYLPWDIQLRPQSSL